MVVYAAYKVKTLSETGQNLKSKDEKSLNDVLLIIFIKLIVCLANRLLGFFKILIFKNHGLLKQDFKNIVIYTVGIVGDNVVMLPALAAIREKYKNAFITVISNCQIWEGNLANEVLDPSRFKDRLIIIKDYPVERRGFKLAYNKHLFPDLKCDLFINLSPFGNRGWIGAVFKELFFAYKLGAEYTVGFHVASYSRKNYFNKIKHYFVQNEPRRSRRVLQELNLKPIEGNDLFEHNTLAKESVINKLRLHGWREEPLFVLNPGAKFASKCWPADRFGEIANHINQTYSGIPVITGISSEKSIADAVAQAAGVKVINLTGQTSMQELVELLRMAKGCVTNDTGTMHIAAMIGLPTVAIFSVRHSPSDWLPLSDKIISLFTLPDCRFCYDDYCQDPICIKSIGVPDVTKSLERLFLV